jgi:diguanylate cyclase (GGDEF)-like protein
MGKNKTLFALSAYAQFALGVLLWALLCAFGPEQTYRFSEDLRLDFFGLGPISHWLLLAFLLAASYAGIRLKFEMNATFFTSFDISFSTAAFFLVSPLAGALVAFAASSADFYHRAVQKNGVSKDKLVMLFFSTNGNRLARFAFAWLALVLARAKLPLEAGFRDLCLALLAYAAYYLSNNLLFIPFEYYRSPDFNLREYTRDSVKLDLPYSFAIYTFGYFLNLVMLRAGLVAFLILSGFILLASWLLSTLTRTQKELKKGVDELTILSRVSAAAASDLDVMPMVESFTRSLAESLPADGIGVVFFQRYATTIYLVQVEGKKSRATYLPEERRFQTNQLPLSEPSVRLGERLFEFLQPLETAPFMIPSSVFGLPLLQGGEPIGGIVVYSYKEDVPLYKKRRLLELCAQSLVVALDNCFLHLQAIQDPLTGLFNRSYFLYRLEEELSYSTRHRAPFALLMVDMDDFKAVNDHLGHAMGDKVIHRIGDLLRRGLRREDVPARYGGDEFIVMLLNCNEQAAVDKAERIRVSLATKALPREEAQGLTIGCSIGMLHSAYLQGDQDLPNLLRRLDEALYRAKQAGKNKVVFLK